MDDPESIGVDSDGRDVFMVRKTAKGVDPNEVHTRLTVRRIEKLVSEPPRPKASMTLVVVVILGFAALALIAWQTTTTLARIEHRQINYLENRPWQASPEPAPSDQSPTDPETPTPLK